MSDDLLEQLASYRRTLAICLRQLANLGANNAPPSVYHGIDDARAAVARLKAQLRNTGIEVDDIHGDVQSPLGDIADQYVAAEGLLASLPEQDIPEPAPLPSGSRVLLRANPLFTGRASDLRALAAELKAGRAVAITTGIGGVGKTQLAVEFAHRYGQFFAGGVFWLSFANPAGIGAEIAACGGAGALELYTDAAGLSQHEQVARVRQAWALPLPRLLVFDNCDDTREATAEQLLAEYLPSSGGCRVLVTSRRGQWRKSSGFTQRKLETLPRPESIALLRRHRPELNDTDADAIAHILGDLPLALSLAGSYLDTYRDEPFGQPAAYLKNLKHQLIAHRSQQGAGAGPSPTKHEQNVRATIQLSYDRLDRANPTDALALAALARASHLAPGEPFPRHLLLATLGDETDDEEIAAARADALRRLVALGLLEPAEETTLRIHRLVSAFAREALDDDAAQGLVEQTLANEVNTLVNAGYPAQLLPLVAHLRHAQANADARADALAAQLANALGRAENTLTNYASARPLYERALAIREHIRGPNHLDTARALNNLAGLLKTQGAYTDARPLYERALALYEHILGPNHRETVTSMSNLAGLLEAQGEYRVAHALYERALEITEHIFGPNHAETATRLNNLASLYYAQGEYLAARPLLERALGIREHTLGPNHPDTATSLNNLGELLRAQGEYAAARPLHERALEITEQTLGPNHPDTAVSLNNLALLLKAQRQYARARTLSQRALAIAERQLGADHPTTLTIDANLASLNATARNSERKIAAMIARAEAAVTAALADPTSDRTTLLYQLEVTARQAEEGEEEGSPYLALAAHMRFLAARLRMSSGQAS